MPLCVRGVRVARVTCVWRSVPREPFYPKGFPFPLVPPSGSATPPGGGPKSSSNGLMRGVSGSGELHAAARPWARGGVTTTARSASASVTGEAASGAKGFGPAFASNGLARVEDGSGTGAAEARTPGGVDATCSQLRGVKRRCAQQSEGRGGGGHQCDRRRRFRGSVGGRRAGRRRRAGR